MLDTVAIRSLQASCIVGVHPHERCRLQPLRVDVRLHLDTRAAAAADRLACTVDYAAVASQVRFILAEARFQLLETAAEVLARWLLLPPLSPQRPAVRSLRVRLSKPQGLQGQGLPSVCIVRRAAEVCIEKRLEPWGSVESVYANERLRIARLQISPGQLPPDEPRLRLAQLPLELPTAWLQVRS